MWYLAVQPAERGCYDPVIQTLIKNLNAARGRQNKAGQWNANAARDIPLHKGKLSKQHAFIRAKKYCCGSDLTYEQFVMIVISSHSLLETEQNCFIRS